MSKEKSKLKSVYNHPFLSEEDPNNPYGVNSENATYENKVYNKFMKIKQHIKLDEGDQEKYSKAHTYLAWSLVGAGVGGFAFGAIFKHLIVSRISPESYFRLQGMQFFYYIFTMAPPVLYAYRKMDDYFCKNICEPMTVKYLKEAQKNGFHDYPISISEFEKLERIVKGINSESE